MDDDIDIVPGEPQPFIYDAHIIDNIQELAWQEAEDAVHSRDFVRSEAAIVNLRRVVFLTIKNEIV